MENNDNITFPNISEQYQEYIFSGVLNNYQKKIQDCLDEYVKYGTDTKTDPKHIKSLKATVNCLKGRASTTYRQTIKMEWLTQLFDSNSYPLSSKYINQVSENVFGDIVDRNILISIPNKITAKKDKNYNFFDSKLSQDNHLEKETILINQLIFLRSQTLSQLLSVDYDKFKIRTFDPKDIQNFQKSMSQKIEYYTQQIIFEYQEKEKIELMKSLSQELNSKFKKDKSKIKL